VQTLEQSFALHVPSSTENLALIREFVTRVGVQAGFSEEEVGQLELAVDEACTNVMEHAYGNDTTQQVVIRAAFDGDAVSITVIDTGRGFDPEDVKQKDVLQLAAERKTGGLGLRLMKSLVDEVRYEIEPGKKNELHMVKRLKK